MRALTFTISFVAFCVNVSKADLFSSIFGLEQLMATERGFEQILNNYIDFEMDRLEALRKTAKDFYSVMPPSIANTDGLSNPINAYRLLKRHVVDSSTTIQLMRQNSAEHFIEQLASHYVLPDTEDLEGAITAIFRIQDTYLITAEQFATGSIPGASLRSPLDSPSINDCFLIASVAFQRQDYHHALPWLLWSEKELNKRANSTLLMSELSFNRTMLYDYLTYSMYAMGNLEHAVYYSRLLVADEPTYQTASYLPIYEQLLKDQNNTWNGQSLSLPPVTNERPIPPMFPNYDALCRGESFMDPLEAATLSCYYKMDRPYLRLAPIKVERVFNDPEVLIFRGALTDSESKALKDISGPNLRRALVVNTDKQLSLEDNIAASFRVAQNFWVPEHEYFVMDQIKRRIDFMTNLDMEKAEQLQIQNYGMGGHYEPHYDMAMENEQIDLNNPTMGNRVATLLFYMSEPEAGGATAFEELKIAVQPKNNDAVFWFNVLKNGRPDMRTRHAACPVVYGQKWVANKWFHERGQEFRRPCDLNPDL